MIYSKLTILTNLVFYLYCEYLNVFDVEENLGRLPKLDNIIEDPFVLKAIAFSVNSKDMIYREILDVSIKKFKVFKKEFQNENLKNFKYYIYVLKNVKKYTTKWLTEEINLLNSKLFKNPNDTMSIYKRNIANFIYHKASDHAVDLVLKGEKISFDGWNSKKEPKEISTIVQKIKNEEL
ncbi:unnamed protein product [Brachionus calyciflorus]|uniref:Uncharacterized protein n=1 Tax=Brachionus calyciflorus TaxID=104777 RepID=A0A813YHM4_9BILA|nr:unnamed protein product [Brachionus calyciflorus]